jgi:nucleotidyltransferase/DNA polymerase involved in DNA repair
MDRTQHLTTRRNLLNWRDRWLEKVDTQLSRELSALKLNLDDQIEGIGITAVIFNDDFIKKKLHPILAEWLTMQLSSLMQSATKELLEVCDKAVEAQSIDSQLKNLNTPQKLLDIATAGLSTAAVFAAIPAAVGASTATVSVGGFLGLLGVTTTVVSMPAVVVGTAVIATAGIFARHRIKKVKTNTQLRLKENMAAQLQEKVLFNRDGTSLNQVLQGVIESTASKLLKELSHVE